MTSIDYIVIAFYMIFMLALGPVYKRFNKTASDYFRGGGGMLWWMVGVSGFMTTFSAWSFTGGAAKAYETGTFFLLLFVCNWLALWFTYFFTAGRFRQMRVITVVEAIRKRFGKANEQFFTWLPMPFNIIFGGISLYAIGIFMACVFNISLSTIVILLGVTVTIMSILGGSWAIIASDFLQMLTLVTITIVMAVLVLSNPQVGGVSGLIEKLPEHHFDWTLFDRPWVIILFAVTLLINQVIQMNNIMAGAAKYTFVKDGRDARKATMISIVGFLVLTPIFMLPAAVGVILHPNLAAEYPTLNNPNEAAYVATALTLLPKGLMGLLVCGIFAATMSSMDSGLNRCAGIIVRNFYLPIINPQASEKRQIIIGQIVTAVFGILMIAIGLMFSAFKSMPLFDLILLCAAAIGIPTAVPLFLGMFIRKAPSWAGWSTASVGFITSLLIRFILTNDNLQAMFGAEPPLTQRELSDINISLTTAILFTVCIGWFMLTVMFHKKRSEEQIKQIDNFFDEMETPIDLKTEHVPEYDNDKRQYIVLGQVSAAYGAFIFALALIPNSLTGHLCFVFCGGAISAVGICLWIIGKKIKLPDSNAPQKAVAKDNIKHLEPA